MERPEINGSESSLIYTVLKFEEKKKEECKRQTRERKKRQEMGR